MFIKIKRRRLGDLPDQHQKLLSERIYFAEDVGAGVLIPICHRDIFIELFLSNPFVERRGENRSDKPVREMDSQYYFNVHHD